LKLSQDWPEECIAFILYTLKDALRWFGEKDRVFVIRKNEQGDVSGRWV